MTTNGPISASLQLIDYMKAADPISGRTAVELATAGLSREQIAETLELIWLFSTQLYAIYKMSKDIMDEQEAQDFADLVANFDESDGE